MHDSAEEKKQKADLLGRQIPAPKSDKNLSVLAFVILGAAAVVGALAYYSLKVTGSSDQQVVAAIFKSPSNGIRWLTPRNFISDTGIPTNCQSQSTEFALGQHEIARAVVAAQRISGGGKHGCRVVLTIKTESGVTIFKRTGYVGVDDSYGGSSKDDGFGIASLVPGADQLIISEFSCGGSCEASDDVSIVSITNRSATEIFQFLPSGINSRSCSSNCAQGTGDWLIQGNTLRIPGDWYVGDRSVAHFDLAIGFDRKTLKPIPVDSNQRKYYNEFVLPTTDHDLTLALAHVKAARQEISDGEELGEALDSQLKPYRDTIKLSFGCQGTDGDCITSVTKQPGTLRELLKGEEAFNNSQVAHALGALVDLDTASDMYKFRSSADKGLADAENSIANLTKMEDSDEYQSNESKLSTQLNDLLEVNELDAAMFKVSIARVETLGMAMIEPGRIGEQGVSKLEAALTDIYLAQQCVASPFGCDTKVVTPESDIPGYKDYIKKVQRF